MEEYTMVFRLVVWVSLAWLLINLLKDGMA